MGTFSALENGLGVSGYFRWQQEVTYGTGVTSSMTDVPIKPDTLLKGMIADIPNDIVVGSRVKQLPDSGRRTVGGPVVLDMHPDLIGAVMNMLLGLSSDAGDADNGYTHTWLVPITGSRIATSYTMQQALGGGLARTFDGCMVTGIVLTSDNEGNQTITLNVIGNDFVAEVARVTSWSFSSLVPYYFGQTTLQVTPTGTTQFTQKIDSLEIAIDLGYSTEDFKLGSNTIDQPKFNAIPTVSLKCTIDADENYMNYAEDKTSIALDLAWASGQQAGGVAGNYSIALEIPQARLSAESEIANSLERTKMELEFDCSYGSTTTGSGATVVMAEVRVLDATAAYPAAAS